MNEQIVREAVAYVHGRIEQQLEHYADRFGISPMELVQRVGTLLVGAQVDHLPALSEETRQAHHALAAVEMVKRTHGGRPSSGAQSASRKTAKSQIKNGYANSWPKGEKARLEESIRRMRKRTDPMAKKILKGLLKKRRESRKNVVKSVGTQ